MIKPNNHENKKVSSTCVFREINDETQFARKLGACETVTIISPESQNYFPPSKAQLKQLTLRELIELRPSVAYSADYRADKDLIFIRNGFLKLRLTTESQAQFGLVSPNNAKMPKGIYIYDLRKGEDKNKRLQWAMSNTIIKKMNFLVFSDEYKSKCDVVSSTIVDIALPPLVRGILNKKRQREEDNDDQQISEIDTMDFNDWANDFIEWVGLAVLNPQLLAENHGGIDPAICNYFPPENSDITSIAVTHLSGTFDVSDVQALWASLQTQKWVILQINGAPQLCDRPELNNKRRIVSKIDGWGQIGIKSGSTKTLFDFLGY